MSLRRFVACGGTIFRCLPGSAALGLAVIAGAAAAADLPAPEQAKSYISVFAGTNSASIGSDTGYVGVTLAPFGKISEPGFRVGLFAAAGRYKYDSINDNGTPPTVHGTFVTTDFLLGYGFVGENWNAKLYGGLNVQDQNLSRFDPGNPVYGTRGGLKVQGDIWVNPTEQTMVFALASYSTAFNTYYATLKTGYEFFHGKEIFFGPEVTLQGNEHYEQWKFGGHITGIKLNEKIELGFSAGYLRSSDVGPGAYGKIELNFDW